MSCAPMSTDCLKTFLIIQSAGGAGKAAYSISLCGSQFQIIFGHFIVQFSFSINILFNTDKENHKKNLIFFLDV